MWDAYQADVDRSLDDLARMPQSPLPLAPKGIQWGAAIRGLEAGATNWGATLVEQLKGFGQVLGAAGDVSGGGMFATQTAKERQEAETARHKLLNEGLDLDSTTSRSLRDRARALRPDPNTAGVAEQLLFEVPNQLTQVAAAAAFFGPAGIPAMFGAATAQASAEELARQGVDPQTRMAIAGVEGLLGGASVVLPVFGSTLLRTGALYAAGGPGMFVAQQLAISAILKNADYNELAGRYDPTDPTGLWTSALVPLPFAAAGALRNLRGAPRPARAPAPPVVAPQPLPEPSFADLLPAQGPAPTVAGAAAPPGVTPAQAFAVPEPAPSLVEPTPAPLSSEQVDAAMVHNLSVQQDLREAAEMRQPALVQQAHEMPLAENLSMEERVIEGALAVRIGADFEQAVADYAARPDAKGGKVLNTDTARELSPDYLADRTQAAAVHEPASWFIKRLYARRLAELPQGSGRVIFTSGGTGAGKTTAIQNVDAVRSVVEDADIIYDTNLNSLASATLKIEQALDAGANVEIIHVQRDPIESLVRGALDRAMRQEAEFGSGRVVPLVEHAKTHRGAAEVLPQLAERYKDHKNVSITVIDNTRGKGAAQLGDIGLVRGTDYNGVEAKLHEALRAEYDAGRISEAVFRATEGTAQGTVSPAARAGAGAGPEQVDGQRAAGAAAEEPEATTAAVVTDEQGGATPPPKPGEPFIVYRVGASDALENRNAGNATAVGLHLTRLDDFESGQPAGAEKSNRVTAYRVVIDAPFGAYAYGSRGGAMAPGAVGRRVEGGDQISYSFPGGGGWHAEPIATATFAELRAAAKRQFGSESFDDLGGNATGAVLREVLGARPVETAPTAPTAPTAGTVAVGAVGAPAAATGNATKVLTERGTEVEAHWQVVEAETLVSSHRLDLTPNPEFPAELQPRDRARGASEQQIAGMAARIRPELLGESVKASDGAPIVGPDAVVESGNARVIALRRAYEAGTAGGYENWLRSNLDRFGLPAEAISGLKNPVLVRVTRGDYDRAEFARQANESTLAVLSPAETAKSDAARLRDLTGLVANDDGSINIAASQAFVRTFLQTLAPTERGAMLQADGRLSSAGLSRIRNAVFARAYGDAELIAMQTEATDGNVKNIVAGMLRAAPDVARLQDLAAGGARTDVDFVKPLVQAVREYSKLREAGRTVAQERAQGNLLEQAKDENPLLAEIENHARAPKRIANLITSMVDTVDARGDPRQRGLLDEDGKPSSVGNVLSEALQRMARSPDAVDEGLPTPQLIQSVHERVRLVEQDDPDMVVRIDEDGNQVTAADELARLRREAIEGTDTELGIDEAKLVRVATNCYLASGAA